MNIPQIEYVDREHWNTVCVAEFVPVTKLEDVQPGDKIVCPRTEEYFGLCHHNTKYPILLTVERLIGPYHYKTVNYGSIAFDLCFKMCNPN